jgi:hypothetical protein
MIAVALAIAATSPQGRAYRNYGFTDSDACGTWAEYRASGRSQALEGWVLGFLSGYNEWGSANGDVAPGVKASGVLLWVDEYCKAHPLDSVSNAAFQLVNELRRRAGTPK